MTAEELRDLIKVLLVDELGYYTLKSGSTPAIALLRSGDRLDRRSVTGLEVVINRTPVSSRPQQMFDGLRERRSWQLYLVQWQAAEGEPDTIDLARQKIERRFPGTGSLTIPIEKNSEQREQVSVKIPDEIEYLEYLT